MPNPIPNTADTLSIFFQPGEDFRDFPVQPDSIFTFGDYSIDSNINQDSLTGTPYNVKFDAFESLDSLNFTGYTPEIKFFVSSKELNLTKKKPDSYSYFSTLKLDTGIALDNIIKNFPYAISVKGAFPFGLSIYDYSAHTNTTGYKYSEFKVPLSSVTNQGGIVLNSGNSFTNKSLLTEAEDFVLQLTGATIYDHPLHKILSYTFSAGSYMQFQVEGIFLTGQTSGTTNRQFYIRPNEKVLANFYDSLSPYEMHILDSGAFKIANPEFDDGISIEKNIPWPKTIDGFNPDTYGSSYENYQESILKLSENIDNDKTDMMIRTMIPENFIEFDSENTIYRNTVQSYAHEFDIIKRYIDGIAFAHTVTYNGEESVPEKFLLKLSELLGWKLKSGFDETDLFEYIATSVGKTANSKKFYDMQIWRRVLVNLIWLFKRKGTREALMFIFKLIGAPDCMIRLQEFVYKINNATLNQSQQNILDIQLSNKVNDNGFIDYESSDFVFQEGGKGRGNGQNYIFQWQPEFDPIKKVDNKKVYTGSTEYYGTENVINTKELISGLDPAQAVECDMFEYYKLSGTCWNWGSNLPFQFQNLTVPFEYLIDDCDLVNPEFITGMTFYDWVDYIYTSNVNPRFRKVSDAHNGSYHYHELRKIYMNYYLNTTVSSNKLSVIKLEKFLQLIELNFYNSIEQLIPSTSILEAAGTIYRNTVFHRQKFVYKRGINDGSEFQVGIPDSTESILTPIIPSATVDDISKTNQTPIKIEANPNLSVEIKMAPININSAPIDLIVNNIGIFNITLNIDSSENQFEVIGGN